jgi:hypothetical protein
MRSKRCLQARKSSIIMNNLVLMAIISSVLAGASISANMLGQQPAGAAPDDARIRQVIDSHHRSWGGMNVPEADGQALYDIVLQH